MSAHCCEFIRFVVVVVVVVRYQFNPAYHQTTVTMQILLKALMMLPNADFIMCRCLIDDANVSLFYNYTTFDTFVVSLVNSEEACSRVHPEKLLLEGGC